MLTRLTFLTTGLLMLACGSMALGAQPFQQDTGPDGIVCMEAENFDLNTPRPPHTWELVSRTSNNFAPADGFSGGFAMQSTPTTLAGGSGITSNVATTSPQLDYVVKFVKTGTYYVWILGYGMDGNSDSLHTGLDGEEPVTSATMSGFNGVYNWSSQIMNGGRPTIEVKTAGDHTVNVWMREDGLTVDKVLLTTNADYTPTGQGPPESPRGALVVASGPYPSDGAVDVPRDVVMSWMPSPQAAAHDVYFGAAFEDVNAASRANPLGVLLSQAQDANLYDPEGLLSFGQTYYWRVDEVNAPPDGTIYKGSVWTFTAEPLAYPLENIIATASNSDAGYGPEHTIDGSGLDAADQHSIDAADMWLATSDGVAPVWIQYEFDRVLKLYELWVWNYNVMFEAVLGYGLKDVTVEYSLDGVEWMALGDFEFAKGTAKAGYTHNTTIDLAGIAARYVRLNVNDNWGMLSQYGLSEVRFYHTPVYPREPRPADGAVAVGPESDLAWRPGREAASHEVHFGTDPEALILIDSVDAGLYDPGSLNLGTTYYWRIAEVNEAETVNSWQGDLWSFATQEYFFIEDFESYTDDIDAGLAIFDTWVDGWVNDTGSTVGYFEAPFAEKTIVNSGGQSMPLQYDNSASPWYSQAERTFETPQNWTVNGADTLVVHFQGRAGPFAELASGRIVMGAAGTDIWNTTDEFRFAHKQLSGNGAVIARVEGVANTNAWAKAGVMIRETLEVGSTFAAVYATPGNGCRYQARLTTDVAAVSDTSVATAEQIAMTVPYWIKIERVGNAFNGYYSADGQNWTAMSWNPQPIAMTANVHIGLAVTSHSAGVLTSGEFSDVATTGNVAGQWQVATIGPAQPEGNSADKVYVAVEDSSGKVAGVTHPAGEAATFMGGWNQWRIAFSDLSGVNLSRVEKMYIGVGDRNAPSAGGSGLIYIDDIRFGHPADAE